MKYKTLKRILDKYFNDDDDVFMFCHNTSAIHFNRVRHSPYEGFFIERANDCYPDFIDDETIKKEEKENGE
jgi:hypothetical protein